MSISVISLDDEQRAIILETLVFSAAFMEARASRIDPDGVVSKAAAIQRKKAQNVAFQLSLGPIPMLSDLEQKDQTHIIGLATRLVEAREAHTRDILLEQVLAFLLAKRAPAKLPSDEPKEVEK